MFAIRMLPVSERGPEGEALGEITIGTFTERFGCFGDAPPEAEWRVRLQALLDGESVVALVHDPRLAWVVYREGDVCFIQQRLALDGNFRSLPPRRTVTDDGRPISEWSTTVGAIRNFLQA